MKTRISVPAAALLFFVGFLLPVQVTRGDESPDDPLRALARAAIADDETIAEAARLKLRDAGPRGLEALIETHVGTVEAMRAGTISLGDPVAKRLRLACDRIAMQRDAFASGLYWFTEWSEAKAAARASGRPILSLRLLGRLDTELSCANSRFFRTTLYSNSEIAKLLRARFVLHWKSVRPVPRVTVDYGDGRRLERTITGNSIHYLLDEEGAVIDAFPGLYSAKMFRSQLETGLDVFDRAKSVPPLQRVTLYADAHRERRQEMERCWESDLTKLGLPASPLSVVRKRFLEQNGGLDSGAVWVTLAGLHGADARLDPASRMLLRAKTPPTAEEAGIPTRSKVAVESPLLRAMRNLESTIAEDTVRNEYLLHSAIREWLMANPGWEVEALNRRVYAELFLTPDNDPWLGLAPRDVLAALEVDPGGK